MIENIPQVNILGTRVAAINMDAAIKCIGTWLQEDRTGRYVCVTDVNGIMAGVRSSTIHEAYDGADLRVPDGMPLVWLGRAQGHRSMTRVYGPDLMLNMLETAARSSYSNYFFGGAEGVAQKLKISMIDRFPGLNVVGTYSPPFRRMSDAEMSDFISSVNSVKPDLLWVALGAPKQEVFMAEHRQFLNAKVLIGVGAAFDFHTGRVSQAPRWVMKAGFEWLFRFLMEPARLGPRYLRNNPAFVLHVILQLTRLRRYPAH